MSRLLQIGLGIVTSMGGFVEAGSVSTAAEAGAAFGFALLWAVAVAAAMLAFLIEMTGRLAAVSGHTFAGAVRERFGLEVDLGLIAVELVLDTLLLAAELGGVATGVHLVTGLDFRWFVVPAAFGAWLLLWRGTFGMIENGVSLLGLVGLSFVIAAWRLGAPGPALARGLVPTLPRTDVAHYGFVAISIMGATVSPYLLNFYSSGAIEDGWDRSALGVNRGVAWLGTGFGSVIAAGILAVAAVTLAPRGVRVDGYDQAAGMMVPAFGRWGVALFAASLGVGCFGAALELSLNAAYVLAQALGWGWGKNESPARNARFSLTYTAILVAAAIVMLSGVDPLALTLVTMVLTVVALPVVVLPLLVIMNDPHYLGRDVNGRASNAIVLAIVFAGAAMAVATVPLEILGGS
ncbi:MAG TPA: divalent metal cation transporter [Candidatus Binatia bacterium]|nr:divalent metal cation transporter [Candidatus Binatia bacterium]